MRCVFLFGLLLVSACSSVGAEEMVLAHRYETKAYEAVEQGRVIIIDAYDKELRLAKLKELDLVLQLALLREALAMTPAPITLEPEMVSVPGAILTASDGAVTLSRDLVETILKRVSTAAVVPYSRVTELSALKDAQMQALWAQLDAKKAEFKNDPNAQVVRELHELQGRWNDSVLRFAYRVEELLQRGRAVVEGQPQPPDSTIFK